MCEEYAVLPKVQLKRLSISQGAQMRLTKKAEPPPIRDVNRDSGTDSANGGCLWRLVKPLIHATDLLFVPALTSVNTLR